MSLGTVSETTADTASVATQESSPATETKPSTGYSVTDPGYETIEPVENELAALKAENTKPKPSETSDDASDTEREAEGTAKTPAGDEGRSAQAADSLDDISDELLDRAVAVGYDLEDIRDFKDAKALEKELTRVEKLQQRLQSKKAVAETVPEVEPEEQKEPDWDQLIEAGHDPDIIALQKSSWQRAAAAEAEVRQLRQVEQARAAAAQCDRFDDILNNLGEAYEPIIGKGRREMLAKSAPDAVANRQKVFTKMSALKRSYELSGEKVPAEEELIQEAFQASFYKQIQEIARRGIKTQIKNAGSQALSRPRSGSAKELPGPERALQKEAEFWKAHS